MLTMMLRDWHSSSAHRIPVVRLLDAPSEGATGATPVLDAVAAESRDAEVVGLPNESDDEPCWDRTSDPQLKRLLLYQLS